MCSCPHCGLVVGQIKAGKTRFGSQRFHCQACSRTYTPVPKPAGRPAALRQQAVRYSLEGLSQRKVARLLGVAPQSVANWLAQASARLHKEGVPLVPAEFAEVVQAQAVGQKETLEGTIVEADEVYSFCNAKREKKGATNAIPGAGSTLPPSSTEKHAAS